MHSLRLVLLLVAVLSGCATPVQLSYDAEVDRRCAIDGGITVYEQVRLPASQFNAWGQYPVQSKNYSSPDAPYFYDSKMEFIHGRDDGTSTANMYRLESWVVRRSDGKTLGVSVSYTRRGGDVPGPWHPSHYSCPNDNRSLERAIFIPEGK